MIILYHKVDKQFEIHPSQINTKLFSKHIDYISKKFTTLTTNEYINSKIKNKLSITFDDGYENILHYAYPIMEKYNLKGTIFIPTDYIGKLNSWDVNIDKKKYKHLDKEQIKFLSDHGWEIGSHSTDHKSLLFKSKKEVKYILEKSKDILENITNKNVFGISFPFGHYNKSILEISNKIYSYSVCVKNLHLKKIKSIYSRKPIYSFDYMPIFKNKLKKNYLFYSLTEIYDYGHFLFTFGTPAFQYIKTKLSDIKYR